MLTANRDEILLWQAELDLAPQALEQARGLLSPAEQARADRFRFEKDQARYTASHAFLRLALTGEIARLGGGAPLPPSLEIANGPGGKPFLPLYPELQFNLSHSAGRALCGITLQRPLGVDLEEPRPIPDSLEIARRRFAPQEFAALQALLTDEREAAFRRLWVTKEAYLKALGEGLSLDLAHLPDLPLFDPGPATWQAAPLYPLGPTFNSLFAGASCFAVTGFPKNPFRCPFNLDSRFMAALAVL